VAILAFRFRRVGELAERAANRARRLLRRPPVHGWATATTRFRSRAGELLERRWPAITAAASSATCRCTWCCW